MLKKDVRLFVRFRCISGLVTGRAVIHLKQVMIKVRHLIRSSQSGTVNDCFVLFGYSSEACRPGIYQMGLKFPSWRWEVPPEFKCEEGHLARRNSNV